ncbi:SMC-Scp complex subunit ScpB [Gemmata sp. G18]|uniref:SMC-Scp complex subunit ScpB n=1 Tax=Gemmata palustris TaxID=2822762 RepID=A0ABS5BPV9_9BACT|nr:SMC-Scp complex subunit ScpB [Gemmata palustris]MBP3955695.1 SMC-Scp complex subunit ScpB [Gemmata palustris]
MNHLRQKFGTAHVRPFTQRPGNAALPLALHSRAEPVEQAAHDPHARDGKLARLEAVLMIADEPLPARKLADVAGLADTAEARTLIARLQALYDSDGSAFQVEEIAGGYQLLTRTQYHTWLARLKRTGHELRLTPATIETLAVIAYRQPIMRAEVEKVRGVACGEVVRQLMEKGLVRVAGRHDSLGRPQVYGTTKKFLQAFGLNTLKDLPEVESLRLSGQPT